MRIATRFYFIVSDIVNKIFALIELFLFLRLMLKFLSANPKAPVVNFIYRGSDILISPFKFIFSDIYWRQLYLIETGTLSAMIGYWIAVFILLKFLRIFLRH